MVPTKVKRVSPAELAIEWDDGHGGRHTMHVLRKYCPCASCKVEIEMQDGTITLPVLKPGQYDIKGIETVGNYALQLTWGDGHRTGIYTYDYLRQICECNDCARITSE